MFYYFPESQRFACAKFTLLTIWESPGGDVITLEYPWKPLLGLLHLFICLIDYPPVWTSCEGPAIKPLLKDTGSVSQRRTALVWNGHISPGTRAKDDEDAGESVSLSTAKRASRLRGRESHFPGKNHYCQRHIKRNNFVVLNDQTQVTFTLIYNGTFRKKRLCLFKSCS